MGLSTVKNDHILTFGAFMCSITVQKIPVMLSVYPKTLVCKCETVGIYMLKNVIFRGSDAVFSTGCRQHSGFHIFYHFVNYFFCAQPPVLCSDKALYFQITEPVLRIILPVRYCKDRENVRHGLWVWSDWASDRASGAGQTGRQVLRQVHRQSCCKAPENSALKA